MFDFIQKCPKTTYRRITFPSLSTTFFFCCSAIILVGFVELRQTSESERSTFPDTNISNKPQVAKTCPSRFFWHPLKCLLDGRLFPAWLVQCRFGSWEESTCNIRPVFDQRSHSHSNEFRHLLNRTCKFWTGVRRLS